MYEHRMCHLLCSDWGEVTFSLSFSQPVKQSANQTFSTGWGWSGEVIVVSLPADSCFHHFYLSAHLHSRVSHLTLIGCYTVTLLWHTHTHTIHSVKEEHTLKSNTNTSFLGLFSHSFFVLCPHLLTVHVQDGPDFLWTHISYRVFCFPRFVAKLWQMETF